MKQWIKDHKVIIGLTLWYGIGWSWALQTDSLDLAGSKTQGLILAILVMAINVAISVAVFKGGLDLVGHVRKKLPQKYFLPLLLLLFAVIDFMVAWVPAALWIGPQGRLDSVLPLSTGALVVLQTPFIFASRLIGFYGLAGFVWTFFYMLAIKQYRKISYLPVVILAALSLVGYVLYRVPNGHDVKVTVISEKFTDRVKPVELSDQDLVVFPEYGLEKIDNKNLGDRLKDYKSSPKKTYFLGSEQHFVDNRYGHENRMVFGDSRDGITFKQDKYRLIPGGEDMPYVMNLILRATGQVNAMNYFLYAKSVITGKIQLHVLDIGNGTRVGAALCSSIIAPQDYRTFTQHDANILTNSASLTTFSGSRLFAWDQRSFGRFMAVANSRYFLQSANSASAYAIDNNGHLYSRVFGSNISTVTAKTNTRRTFYTFAGEWMAWLGGVTATGILLWAWFGRRGWTLTAVKNSHKLKSKSISKSISKSKSKSKSSKNHGKSQKS